MWSELVIGHYAPPAFAGVAVIGHWFSKRTLTSDQ